MTAARAALNIDLSNIELIHPSDSLTEPLAEPPMQSEAGREHVLGQLATIAGVDGLGQFILDDGRHLAPAISCLVQPQIGDIVLVCTQPAVILAILERRQPSEARISVPGATMLRVQHRSIAIETSDTLALRSLRDTELSAATGTLNIAARNLYMTALETLVERAADRIAKIGSYALEVSGLLRMHTGHGIFTANKQIRIDAEQLHLG